MITATMGFSRHVQSKGLRGYENAYNCPKSPSPTRSSNTTLTVSLDSSTQRSTLADRAFPLHKLPSGMEGLGPRGYI